MKECATICGYTNAKRCSLRGLRSAGITEIVNCDESVSKKDKLLASRHKNIATHLLYQRTTSKSCDSRYKVFGAKNSPESKDANKVEAQSKTVAPTYAASLSTPDPTPASHPPIFQNPSYPPLFPVPTPPYFPSPSPYFSHMQSPYFAHPMMANTHYNQLFLTNNAPGLDRNFPPSLSENPSQSAEDRIEKLSEMMLQMKEEFNKINEKLTQDK